MAGIGAVSIVTGSTPAVAKACSRASGRQPCRAATSEVVISRAAAPSEICEELPAVTTPSSRNDGAQPRQRLDRGPAPDALVGRDVAHRRQLAVEAARVGGRPPPTRAPSMPSWHPSAPCWPTKASARDSTLETLGGLRTVFREDGVVTAGNSSQISDGAAALLVTTSEIAARHGWRPLARLHAFATAGVDPVTMLTAPIPATARVLERAGLTVDDIDAFEVNEAFASVVGAWLAETRARPDRVNPRGGAIALGHPLGGSGARLMTTLVHHLVQTGGRCGLQTMCEGGGMANATVLERL